MSAQGNLEREPTPDELAAMAYVDGELGAPERARFEARLSVEPALAREVAQLRRLELLARQAAPSEPIEGEWERLRGSSAHRASLGLGWTLFLAGLAGLGGWGLWCVECSDLGLVPKLALAALVVGAALLVGNAVHARRRTLPYDPYTDVKR